MQLLAQPLLGFLLIGNIISLLITIFWIWMIVDCITNGSLTGTSKIIWLLVVIFLPLIGSLLYFLMARGGRVSGPRI